MLVLEAHGDGVTWPAGARRSSTTRYRRQRRARLRQGSNHGSSASRQSAAGSRRLHSIPAAVDAAVRRKSVVVGGDKFPKVRLEIPRIVVVVRKFPFFVVVFFLVGIPWRAVSRFTTWQMYIWTSMQSCQNIGMHQSTSCSAPAVWEKMPDSCSDGIPDHILVHPHWNTKCLSES